MNEENLLKWLDRGEHLPEQLRDFHDQKNFFKSMHFLQASESENFREISWRDGHVYTIDRFLWFMATRGYTLQKTRKKGLEIRDWPDYRELISEENK
ncbi:MAG: hypothetical protein SWL02_14835 [Pseudomonadota bacterium]|nr:hypothetical protein [Pseudomonadota bacterium]